jgi:hypothetical protein
MALALPLLLVLIWGPLEIGNYFMNEHTLIKGVRDGAIYAAHQDISNYDCSAGTPTVPQNVQDDTKALVRTGQLSGGTDRLRNWGSATFSVSFSCVTQSTNGTTLSGIYALNAGKVPIVRIDASLPYASILGNLGFRPATLTVSAKQEATVMGI